MTPDCFSISMPIGAWHPLLRDAIESLLAQDASVQIAFLDASGDVRVKAIADEYNAHLHYRRHGPDKGQSDAILEGWRETDGEFLGWLNADDLVYPGALDLALKQFQNDRSIDLVYGHSTIIDDAKRIRSYHWAVEATPPHILEGGIISQPSCFFKRKAYEAIAPLNVDLHYTMDWDLWIRLYKSGAKFQFIDAPMSLVLWAEGTKTSSFNAARQAELRRIIQEYAPDQKQKKIMRSFAIHNFMDRLPGRALQKTLARLLIRGRKTINGLSGDGQLLDGAKVPIVHYDDTPKTTLEIRADNANAISHILCDGVPHDIGPTENGVIKITLQSALSKAQTLWVAFSVGDNETPYLEFLSLK